MKIFQFFVYTITVVLMSMVDENFDLEFKGCLSSCIDEQYNIFLIFLLVQQLSMELLRLPED